MYDVISFRIHVEYKKVPEFVKSVSEASERLVVYEHNGPKTRTHIHGYIEKLTVSTDTLKNWIKKELGVTAFPRNDWAFPEKIEKGPKKGQPVDRESLMYFHKGQYPLLYNKGFTDEEVEEQHKKSYKPVEYVGKSEKVQYKLVCENPTQKKHRENDLIKMMMDKYANVSVLERNDDVLCGIIRDVLTETKTVCGMYKAIEYFDVINMRMSVGRWNTDFHRILSKRNPR